MVVLREQLTVLTARRMVALRPRSIKVGKVTRLSLFSKEAEEVIEFCNSL